RFSLTGQASHGRPQIRRRTAGPLNRFAFKIRVLPVPPIPHPKRRLVMAELRDGESVEMAGSSSRPYVLKNVGGVYSCSCPAWRHQSLPIERRTCKHLRRLRGDAVEAARVGGDLPAHPATPTDV